MADCQEEDSPAFNLPTLSDASKQIRLLHIFPAETDDDNTIIRCEITARDIQDVQGSYTAISYTWGPSTPTKHIEVNGSEVLVRNNCWHALWQMRLHSVSNLYWIDNLCIDQKIHAEKALQVRQMDVIYSNAEQVAACIGESSSDQWLYFGRSSDGSASRNWSPVFDAISERSYFRRAWTVQECLLAKGVRLFCAQYSTTLDSTVANRVRHSTTVARLRGLATEKSTNRDVELLAEFLDDCSIVKEEISVGSIGSRTPHQIRHYFTRDCYDPRDKLYAVLSLLAPEFRQRLPINYEQSLFHVLIDLSSVCDRLVLHGPRPATDKSTTLLAELVEAVRALHSEFRFASDPHLDAYLDAEYAFSRDRFALRSAQLDKPCMVLGPNIVCIRIATTVDVLFTVTPSSMNIHSWQRRHERAGPGTSTETILFTSNSHPVEEWPEVLKHWRRTSSEPSHVPKYYLRPVVRAPERERCPISGRFSDTPCKDRCVHNTYDSVLRIVLNGIERAFMVPNETAEGDLVLHHDHLFFICRRTSPRSSTCNIIGEAIPLTGTSPLGNVEPFDPTSHQIMRWPSWNCDICMCPEDILFLCIKCQDESTKLDLMRFLVRTPVRTVSMDLPFDKEWSFDLNYSLDKVETFLSPKGVGTDIVLQRYMLAAEEEERLARKSYNESHRLTLPSPTEWPRYSSFEIDRAMSLEPWDRLTGEERQHWRQTRTLPQTPDEFGLPTDSSWLGRAI